MTSQDLPVFDLGIKPYAVALQFQKQVHKLVSSDKIRGGLILTEHEPILTLGKNASADDILNPIDHLKSKGIDFCRVERGGKVTAHMPGQLVVYPIIPLTGQYQGVCKFVQYLENAVIKLLSSYGVAANTRPGSPGVWVKNKKICSLGIRVSQRVTWHGFAININNNLDLFKKINPCGEENASVTSLFLELGRMSSLPEVKNRMIEALQRQLKVQITQKFLNPDLKTLG